MRKNIQSKRQSEEPSDNSQGRKDTSKFIVIDVLKQDQVMSLFGWENYDGNKKIYKHVLVVS